MVSTALALTWTDVGEVAVALPTFALAIAAYLSTRAATRSARAAEAQVEAQTQPLLIDVSLGPRSRRPKEDRTDRVQQDDGHVGNYLFQDQVYFHLTEEAGYLSVPVRNVGNGLADIQGVALPEGEGGFAGTTARPNLPPGESTRFDFIVPKSSPDAYAAFAAKASGIWREPGVPWDTSGIITCEVSYTDLSGGQPTKTRIETRKDDQGASWWVLRVQHTFGKDALPLFEVDPMNLRC